MLLVITMSLEISLIDLERFFAKSWREFAKHDPLAQLSFNEYDYLRIVQDNSQGIRITDLAAEMKVTKPSASNMVVKLERKGLVERQASPDDARVKVVLLTDKATTSMSQESDVYRQIAAVIAKRLNADEVEQLTELLGKVVKE